MQASRFTVAGLFAGAGGFEEGLHRSGGDTVFLSELWEPARAVLRRRFRAAELAGDIVHEVKDLPAVDVVTAGFPCTDISQAGATAGINGSASGLIFRALGLVRARQPEWVLLENVPNMLYLARGEAMTLITTQLAQAGYSWAYRVIDSRAFGVPQRRRRVFVVASRSHDAGTVLFRGDVGAPPEDFWRADAFGFYWTEGNRGIGWARDAVPTLKGSTTASVPSPPGTWLPEADLGTRVLTPSIRSAEVLQGFRPGWTESAPPRDRWKLIGNAVTPRVAEWIGESIADPSGDTAMDTLDIEPLDGMTAWPTAAFGIGNKRWAVRVSEWPVRRRYTHLRTVLHRYGTAPLSLRATNGFRTRLERSNLRYAPEFHRDLVDSELWQAHREAHRRNVARRTSASAGPVDADARLEPPRYWAVHTLAHLVIRQMAMDAGYGSASLSERLYAWRGDGDHEPAAGFLISTTSPDSDGTLGGLVEQSAPKAMERLVARALDRASRCSSDPVCSHRVPRGQEDFLHGAACHFCTFLSETSCDNANRFLDRRLVLTLYGDQRATLGVAGLLDVVRG